MITENLSTLKIHKLTQAQYDRELAAGRIDENALYLTPDDVVDYATTEYVDTQVASLATLPAVTNADNGKVLMVVNGAWKLVDLTFTADENGVVSV